MLHGLIHTIIHTILAADCVTPSPGGIQSPGTKYCPPLNATALMMNGPMNRNGSDCLNLSVGANMPTGCLPPPQCGGIGTGGMGSGGMGGFGSFGPGSFGDKMAGNDSALRSLMRFNPEAGDMFRGAYGRGVNETFDPRQADLYRLPDPHELVKTVEEATALFLSVKDYLRVVLEKVKAYLQRSAVLLAELSADLSNKYGELKETTRKYNAETSPQIKAVLGKKIISLRAELAELIRHFEEIRKWQMTVTGAISSTL